jgi:two-component system, NarL family, nitrate/nitrite response regulator NarL
MGSVIRVVVADDHPLFREGVVLALGAESDIEVVGQASTAYEAMALVSAAQPDVVLLDANMPGDGIEAASWISADWPDTRAVILTLSDHDEDVTRAVRGGAAGYILKGVAGTELCEIVRQVRSGKSYVAPAVAPVWERCLART